MSVESIEFVDTNVLLYAYGPADGKKFERANVLVRELGRGRRGALSIQVLQEFYVNATRKIAEPLDPETASERVGTLGLWHVHTPVVSDVSAAIDLHRTHEISFWDAMILRSATQLGCSVVWSEDLNSGQAYDGVEVRNPFAD